MSNIRLRGLTIHNLKSIDLDIELGGLTLIKGPSGAGKSSLAFDTIYAESQRRYIETFSPYARQFFERLAMPPASCIEGLPAAVAIGQANPVRSARSTVGTLAEVTYPARHLFSREADFICPGCGRKVMDQGPEAVLAEITSVLSGLKTGFVIITAPVACEDLSGLAAQGYDRILAGNEIKRFEDGSSVLAGHKEAALVIDRVGLSGLDPERIIGSSDQAFAIGNRRLSLHLPSGRAVRFSRGRHCPYCDKGYTYPGPNLFSFNSPSGACPACRGFGRVMAVDWDLVVPDKGLSIRGGAVRPLENWQNEKAELMAWCSKNGVDINAPWGELDARSRQAVLFGHGSWPGVKAYFDYLETKRYKAHVRILLSRYRAYLTCPECGGTRFKKEVNQYVIGGLTLPGLYALPVRDAISWLKGLKGALRFDKASLGIYEELRSRLSTLEEAGLGYLALDRQSRSLSGGEVARIALARAIGTGLTQTLYVLDEPTAGLHPADRFRLIGLVTGLRDIGNTLVVVEHDPQFEAVADLVVELGPGSGGMGGRLTYVGPPRTCAGSLAMEKADEDRAPARLKGGAMDVLIVSGVCANNLKNITVSFPLNAFTCLTGVSGSGKSTLLELVLYRGLLRAKGLPVEPPGCFAALSGTELAGPVHLIGQDPAGRTPRAAPASYLRILDGIRALFASTDDAREKGLSSGAFSFNTEGGRCPACKGQGSELVEMQFLPDVTLPCPVCKGRRFKEEVLAVRYRGINMHEVLEMTIDEAYSFFGHVPGIKKAVLPAQGLGLGYLRLGQPLNTLSPGEAQRLKLARRFSPAKGAGGDVFLLDEPSRGLGQNEIQALAQAIRGLLDNGHTVIAVEHEPGLIIRADWVVDLGPHGGDDGGRLIYEGPPKGLLDCEGSITGRFLKYRITGGKGQPGVAAGAGCSAVRAGDRAMQGRLDAIDIKGARHHNLKGIDVEIPHGKFVVITGPSGSGKSSLAFDVVFSEGQRRFVEGLSSYMRQFIRLYERPDVDCITGLTPSVAIEQRTSGSGPRSTVATLTEIAHYLRLLYAKASSPVCPSCKRPLEAGTRDEILGAVLERWAGSDVLLLAPRLRRRKGLHEEAIKRAIGLELRKVRVDDKFYDIPPVPVLSRHKEHTVDWVFGPLTVKDRGVTSSLLDKALAAGMGEVIIYDSLGSETHFSEHFSCPSCGVGLSRPDPLLFSFHAKAGECRKCLGIGRSSSSEICDACHGSRLNDEARAWRIDGLGIDRLLALEVGDALNRLSGWLLAPPWPERLQGVAGPLVESAVERLRFLSDVGLVYLPLDRSGDTLSGGEAQRIRLAAQVGAGLTGITIVLDEPTIGLHPTDNKRLLSAICSLKN
ncbi:MAG: excinuclease ABC subunit UvrA, partial [Desulfobacteraceae bacterium]|nr:excinuclease ABC subunit UvrA [Desulfobacteraceae bacterium]